MNNTSNINFIEKEQMGALSRIFNSDDFKSDLKQIEAFIQNNYEELHFMWGIKNKLKIAAERLVRFHIWKHSGLTHIYHTPLSSDVAYILNDCVMNIDCKTIDSAGNKNDRKFIQFEPNQVNFENIPLHPCQIELPNGSKISFEGFEFHPRLEKTFNGKPVLSFFIFINYRDDGDNFYIEGTEICCMPHNQIVSDEFESNIISGFKTYRYLKKLQAEKIDKSLLPRKEPKSNWIKFRNSKRYYDDKGTHPFDPKKLLIWGWESNHWNVCLGGHTTRVLKEKIKKRHTEKGREWMGWEKIK